MISLFNNATVVKAVAAPTRSMPSPPARSTPYNPSGVLSSSFEAAFANGSTLPVKRKKKGKKSVSALAGTTITADIDLTRFSGKRLQYIKAKLEAEEKRKAELEAKAELAKPKGATKKEAEAVQKRCLTNNSPPPSHPSHRCSFRFRKLRSAL